MTTRWQIWAERRWRCARDLTVAMMRGATVRVSTPEGLVCAGGGGIYDWRRRRPGDAGLSCRGEADAEVAVRLTAEFDVPHLRRALRQARRHEERRVARGSVV